MFQIRAKLLYNKRVKDKYFHLAIKVPQIGKTAVAGQFLNVKVREAAEPLLRRPFSIHRVTDSGVEILYEVVGKGTEILAQKKSGEYLDVIGPSGNGFNYTSHVRPHMPHILVAGGMGVAPLLFLAERLVTSHRSPVTSKPLVLIGAKNKNQILCEKEFKKLGYDVKIATDDGSRGFKGKVTELLEKILLSAVSCQLSAVYACGPRPMLKEISRIANIYKIPAQISLEEHMACGIGACLGCVVNTKEGFKRVCKDGPIFNAKEIVW